MQVGGKYIKPNLDQFEGATTAEKSYAERYTFIRPCTVLDLPEAHTAWFRVGGQEFRIDAGCADNESEASWMCWMFAKALLQVGP